MCSNIKKEQVISFGAMMNKGIRWIEASKRSMDGWMGPILCPTAVGFSLEEKAEICIALSMPIYQLNNRALNQRDWFVNIPRWQVDTNQSHDGSCRKMRET